MKQLILGLALLGSIGSNFAESADFHNTDISQKHITYNAASQGQSDVQVFKDITQNGGLYTLLLAMNAGTPDASHAAQFTMLINEMHLMNVKLTAIAESLQNGATINVNSMPSEGMPHG